MFGFGGIDIKKVISLFDDLKDGNLSSISDPKMVEIIKSLGIGPMKEVKYFMRELASEEQLEADPDLYTYTIMGFAKDCDTSEDYIIYIANYNNPNKVWIRKLNEFFVLVDKEQYPESTQTYKYELL